MNLKRNSYDMNRMRIRVKPIALTRDAKANAFDMITDIVKFVGAFGLCRDARDNQGNVTAKNIRTRCAVVSLTFITLSCLCLFYRLKFTDWKDYSWKLNIYSEFMYSVVMQLTVCLIIWGSVAENERMVIHYYADLTRLDQVLDIRNADHYSQERIILNQRFFSLLIFYTIKVMCEALLWMMSIGFTKLCSYIIDYLSNIVQFISQFYYFVRLCVLRSRLVFLHERLELDLKKCDIQRKKDRYVELVKKYKFCYILLHAQHNSINRSHGFKITVSVASLVYSIVEAAYEIFIFAAYKDNSGLLSDMVHIVPDLALFSMLILYIARIRHLADVLQDRLELLLSQSSLTEMEQRSVLELVELIQRQPLRFTAHDFFTLDMPLLCSLFHLIINYIIIFTQIKNPSEF